MKKAGVISLVLFLLLEVSNVFAIKQYTISELKQNPKFNISISATGEHSEKSIELKVKSDYKRDVEMLIPTGTVFYTSDESHQILIVVEEQLLVIQKGRLKKKSLDGFCTEASDGVPSTEMAMEFMPTKREKLQKLADYLNSNKDFDSHEIQEAVWCVSDNHSVSNIYASTPKKSKQLQTFVAELTGQKITWNSVKRNHRIVNGYIETEPVFVSGKIVFSTESTTKVKSKIIDDEGNDVYLNPDQMTLPKTDRAELEFGLTVNGWESGTYYVVYYDQNDKTILKKEFKL